MSNAAKNWAIIHRRNKKFEESRRKEYNELQKKLGLEGTSAKGFVPSRTQVNDLKKQLRREEEIRGERDRSPVRTRNRPEAEPEEQSDPEMPANNDEPMELTAEEEQHGVSVGRQTKSMSRATGGVNTSLSVNIGTTKEGSSHDWIKQTRTVKKTRRVYFMGEPRITTAARRDPANLPPGQQQTNIFLLDTKFHKMPDKQLSFYLNPADMIEMNPAAQAFSVENCEWKLMQPEFLEDVQTGIQVIPEELPTLSHDVEIIHDSHGFVSQYGYYTKVEDGIYNTTTADYILDDWRAPESTGLAVEATQYNATTIANDQPKGIPGWVMAFPSAENLPINGIISSYKTPDLMTLSTIGPMEELGDRFSMKYPLGTGIMALNMLDKQDLKDESNFRNLDINKMHMGAYPLMSYPAENSWKTDRPPTKDRLPEFLFRVRPQSRIKAEAFKTLFCKALLVTECTFSTYIRNGYHSSFERGGLNVGPGGEDKLWAFDKTIPGDASTRRYTTTRAGGTNNRGLLSTGSALTFNKSLTYPDATPWNTVNMPITRSMTKKAEEERKEKLGKRMKPPATPKKITLS